LRVFIFQLFDFDLEVEPILEVLVGKTVEQALTEVLEEEELEGLRAQQRRFRELRASEQAELQRLEEQERRLQEEKVTNAQQAFQQDEIILTETS
jgi:predicted RNase H-like nuclease (RuvC/YqgF family)